MIVYCNFSITNQPSTKELTLFEFVSGMGYHFQNLNFGDGVKEISYLIVGNDPSHLSFYGPGIVFGRKNRTVSSLFVVGYEMVLSLEGEKLFKFIHTQLINESFRFGDKKIKNFDLESYVKSLDKYLSEATQLMLEGKLPAEGKVLNEDIQTAIAKKFSKL